MIVFHVLIISKSNLGVTKEKSFVDMLRLPSAHINGDLLTYKSGDSKQLKTSHAFHDSNKTVHPLQNNNFFYDNAWDHQQAESNTDDINDKFQPYMPGAHNMSEMHKHFSLDSTDNYMVFKRPVKNQTGDVVQMEAFTPEAYLNEMKKYCKPGINDPNLGKLYKADEYGELKPFIPDAHDLTEMEKLLKTASGDQHPYTKGIISADKNETDMPVYMRAPQKMSEMKKINIKPGTIFIGYKPGGVQADDDDDIQLRPYMPLPYNASEINRHLPSKISDLNIKPDDIKDPIEKQKAFLLKQQFTKNKKSNKNISTDIPNFNSDDMDYVDYYDSNQANVLNLNRVEEPLPVLAASHIMDPVQTRKTKRTFNMTAVSDSAIVSTDHMAIDPKAPDFTYDATRSDHRDHTPDKEDQIMNKKKWKDTSSSVETQTIADNDATLSGRKTPTNKMRKLAKQLSQITGVVSALKIDSKAKVLSTDEIEKALNDQMNGNSEKKQDNPFNMT
jgi:hypothetical protein